jgi:hypothetical protein
VVIVDRKKKGRENESFLFEIKSEKKKREGGND